MSSSQKIRIGFIGVGGIAQGHIERIARSGRAEVAALCDPSEKSLASTRERHGAAVAGAPVYSDYGELLEKSKPDAVIICSRHSDHFSQILDSLDAGVHVLTEKPLVNSVRDGHVVVQRAASSGKVVGIAYQRHTQPEFVYIRERIASGTYGRVQAVSALQQQGWKRATTGTWRQDPAVSGGGQLHDSGSHLVDIVLWTTGLSARSVAANIDKRGAPVDINSALTVRFAEDAVGTITVVGDSMRWYEDITIWCEQGTFYMRQNGGLCVQSQDGSIASPRPDDLPHPVDIDANFLDAIEGRAAIAAPPICGLRTMELTEAAWRSGDKGGVPVTVEHV